MRNEIINNGMFTTIPQDMEFGVEFTFEELVEPTGFMGMTDEEIANLQEEIFGDEI